MGEHFLVDIKYYKKVFLAENSKNVFAMMAGVATEREKHAAFDLPYQDRVSGALNNKLTGTAADLRDNTCGETWRFESRHINLMFEGYIIVVDTPDLWGPGKVGKGKGDFERVMLTEWNRMLLYPDSAKYHLIHNDLEFILIPMVRILEVDFVT